MCFSVCTCMERSASSEDVASAWYCLAWPAADAAASCADPSSSRSSRTSAPSAASLQLHCQQGWPVPQLSLYKGSGCGTWVAAVPSGEHAGCVHPLCATPKLHLLSGVAEPSAAASAAAAGRALACISSVALRSSA